MKLSKMHLKTLREVPSEAELPSHVLLLRTGMIRKLVSGVYDIPENCGTIKVKITDLLSESLELEVR